MENKDYYSSIKDHLIRNEINHRIKDYSKNKGDLETYYNVGKLLVIAQGGESRAKYGDGLIKEYSRKLKQEVNMIYSERTLRRMRQFYILFKNEKWSAVPTNLSWSHIIEVLPLTNSDERNYYLTVASKDNISYRELSKRIKNKEYERLPEQVKNDISNKNELTLVETVKDPIIIPNPDNIEVYKEELLQKLIIENYQYFLRELGEGYNLTGNEYPIKIGDRYYKIDLLLYNKKYKAYVVIELKIGEVKHKDYGQIKMYTNYIDENLKEIDDNNTIGIILCHKNNRLVVEYCSNPNILVREYVLN